MLSLAVPEGGPTAGLEAMAAGVPVIAASVGGVAEVLEDGFNARLVPPGDVGRLAAALIEVASHPETRSVAGASVFQGRASCVRSRTTTSLCMPAKDALSAAVKQGMLTLGQYRRTLRARRCRALPFSGITASAPTICPRARWRSRTCTSARRRSRRTAALFRECCDPITLDDWREAAAGRTPLPPRPVLITFDDGYRSVARIGAPILAAHKLPAVVFVCSDPIANRRLLWFDAVAARDGEAAVERWKTCDYEAGGPHAPAQRRWMTTTLVRP